MINSEIAFGDERVEKDFLNLDNVREKSLKEQIEKAFCNLEEDAFCGIQIPKKLIPKEYFKRLVILLICGNIIFLMLGD